MRTSALVFALVLSVSGPAFAQEDWTEYQNNQDGFKVDFPGKPKVTETTWKTQFDYTLPARVYSAERGRERYSLTVVDYNGLEPQGVARRKACPAGAEPCIGSDLSGPGFWKHDVRGALIYASFKFIQRDVKVTHFLWSHEDLVEGLQLQLTNNADQSRTFVYISMHEMKLYVLEGTVPKGYPAAGLVSAVDGVGRQGRERDSLSDDLFERDLRSARPRTTITRWRWRRRGSRRWRCRPGRSWRWPTRWRRRRRRAAVTNSDSILPGAPVHGAPGPYHRLLDLLLLPRPLPEQHRAHDGER